MTTHISCRDIVFNLSFGLQCQNIDSEISTHFLSNLRTTQPFPIFTVFNILLSEASPGHKHLDLSNNVESGRS